MSRSCSRGSIRRKSYNRRSRSGHRVHVKSTCIPDRGLPGHGPKILPIPERGVLSRFGYMNVKDTPEEKRHAALKRAINEYGHRKTIGHLVLISNLVHRSDPAAYAIFKRDQEWISAMYQDYKAKHGMGLIVSSKKSRSRSRSGSLGHKHSRKCGHRSKSRSKSRSGSPSRRHGKRGIRRNRRSKTRLSCGME